MPVPIEFHRHFRPLQAAFPSSHRRSGCAIEDFIGGLSGLILRDHQEFRSSEAEDWWIGRGKAPKGLLVTARADFSHSMIQRVG